MNWETKAQLDEVDELLELIHADGSIHDLDQYPVDRMQTTTGRVMCGFMHGREKLRSALEYVLAYLTNVNSVDEHAMVSMVLDALKAAGTPQDDLDAAAIALLRGAARATNGGAE